MSQLSVPVFRITSPTQVWVDSGRKRMVIEHSDMGNMALQSQLYDDACDVGFAMLNTQTGVETRWYLIREVRDTDGDLNASIFGACTESIRKNPELHGWVVHVLND